MSDETITSLVLGAAVAVFVWDRLPVAVVAVGVARPGARRVRRTTVIFIASLFVVSEALDATGV